MEGKNQVLVLRTCSVTKNLVRGQKMVLGLFFAAKNGPRTKLTLQNLVHVGKFGPLVY